MTPLGAKLREMRSKRNISLKQMAKDLDISSAYLSALEHGKRGRPTWFLLQRIITYFNVIWDEAEELQQLAEISNPKITINTAGLEPEATELSNILAMRITALSKEDLIDIKNQIITKAIKTS